MIPKLNSSHGSETRNIINRVIEVLNEQGKTIQDLVAEGQLTEEQYAELITVINGLIKSGHVDKSDLTSELKDEIEGFSTQLQQTGREVNATNLRIDNLVIPLSPENANVEVTDSHVSNTRNKTFSTLKNRLEQTESDIFIQGELSNELQNGDFSDGLRAWKTTGGEATAGTKKGIFVATAHKGNFYNEMSREINHKYFYSITFKSNSDLVGFDLNGAIPTGLHHSGSGNFESRSIILNSPSASIAKYGIVDWRESGWDEVEVKNVMVIDLTKIYGSGNEPSLEYVNNILTKKHKGYANESGSLKISDVVLEQGHAIKNKADDNASWISGLKSDIVNGDFNKGLDSWELDKVSASVTGNGIAFTSTSENGRVIQRNIKRSTGDKIYYSAIFKTNSNLVGIDVNGGIYTEGYHTGSGEFERRSVIGTAPRNDFHTVGINDTRKSDWDEIEIKQVIVINLTELLGAGNEYSLEHLEGIIDDYYDGFISDDNNNGVSLTDVIKNHDKALKLRGNEPDINTNSRETARFGITKNKEVYPILFGVKTTNEKDVFSPNGAEVPRPIGWLYYIPEAPYEILYASGSPENMKHLCYWNTDLPMNGYRTPESYRPFITKDGDIIFVWRGDLLGYASDYPHARQNPIVYPAGDWDNPVVVELEGIKPTAWLQNCGADYIYSKDIFMFSEYTRPSHKYTHTWKVTKPFTDPNNWKIVQSFELSGSNFDGMKHSHTINYDPFSGVTYLTTGDDDEASKILSSSDFGDTWSVEYEGQRRYARVLNFVFTKDKVFWANDDGQHGLYSVDRDPITRVPDFTNITTLYDLTGHPATYINCLIDDPNGILILNRFDGVTDENLSVFFWHIPTSTMHVIKEIGHAGGVPSALGFRVEAVNWYQPKGERKIVTGFANPVNSMDLLGNSVSSSQLDRVNNLVLEVVPSGDTFGLKVSAISDRR